MQKELEDAARDTRPVSPDRLSLKEVAGLPTAVPTKVSVTFVRLIQNILYCVISS